MFRTMWSVPNARPSYLAALTLAGSLSCSSADAHSWYPKECCSDGDCAPVESISLFASAVNPSTQLLVKSRHGTAILEGNFPVRESQDGRMHVCMRHSETDPFGDISIACFFAPASM